MPKLAQKRAHMSTGNTRAAMKDFATKLDALANELDKGNKFSVTKLTPIKRLCADHEFATRFASHFAEIAHRRFLDKELSKSTPESEREAITSAVEFAMKSLKLFNDGLPLEQMRSLLDAVHSQLKESQNTFERHQWGPVRVVYSNEALSMEMAMECMLRPHEASSLCYQIARVHAERYDPRFGSGLIPASADAVRDIGRLFHDEAKKDAQ